MSALLSMLFSMLFSTPVSTLVSTLLTNPRLRRLYRASAALMYLTILVSGSIPGARADIGQYASGPELHSTAYAILACLCWLGSGASAAPRLFKAVLAVALMGAADEFVQSFFPYRHADVRDWAVDVASALVTATLLSVLLSPVLRQPPSTAER